MANKQVWEPVEYYSHQENARLKGDPFRRIIDTEIKGRTITLEASGIGRIGALLPEGYALCRATTIDDAAVPVEIRETIKSALRHTRNDLDTEYFTVTIWGRNREMVDKALAWLDGQQEEATDAN